MHGVSSASNRIVAVVCFFMLLSCSGFMMPGGFGRMLSLKSDTGNYNANEIETELTIQDEIREIIQIFVNADGGVGSINPSVLMENAHILTKGKLYEYAIEKTIEECANVREIAKIEAVDAFMKGFIVSERKQRSRLKMNYMMSGASSNRLDEAITLLSERFVIDIIPVIYTVNSPNVFQYFSQAVYIKLIKLCPFFPHHRSDEIDDSLINYVDTLIRKEVNFFAPRFPEEFI